MDSATINTSQFVEGFNQNLGHKMDEFLPYFKISCFYVI